MNKDSKIWIAGHTGLVGSAIHRKLIAEGYTNIVTRTSKELNLANWDVVWDFYNKEKPNYVFNCAAKVGGVGALNTFRADVLRVNLEIQTNIISLAKEFEVKKLLFFGSNCLYPKLANQPLKEEYILSGKLEPTTESYAIAKIAGIKMCEAYRTQYGCNFITLLPVNLYGANDNHDLATSHVMPALLTKFKNAIKNDEPEVEIWGSGGARREFMHVDDLADAALFMMLNYNEAMPINIGTGSDISILELALLIKKISGYQGQLKFDTSKPEGIKAKMLDVTRIHNLGWEHKIKLEEGIKMEFDRL